MFKLMRKRFGDEGGFTLIELMVVVLIIAVLVAIAIPSFLGFRNRAQDRASQSDLRNVLLAEKAYWTDEGAYTATQADLNSYEPTIVIGAGAVTAALQDAGAVVCLEVTSGSGTVFGVWESEVSGTFYGSGAIVATCPAEAAGAPAGYTQAGW